MPSTLMDYYQERNSHPISPLDRFRQNHIKLTRRDVTQLENDTQRYFEVWLDKTGKRGEALRLAEAHQEALARAPNRKPGNLSGCLGGQTSVQFTSMAVDNLLFGTGSYFQSPEQKELYALHQFVESAREDEKQTRYVPKTWMRISRATTRIVDSTLEILSPCPDLIG